jgi:hypothetical protein
MGDDSGRASARAKQPYEHNTLETKPNAIKKYIETPNDPELALPNTITGMQLARK